jgi:23S rRNA (uridine2552-2'-O)-methyltransferase
MRPERRRPKRLAGRADVARQPDYTGEESRSKRARQLGYAARSVFKLEELDRRFRLLRPGDRVLDLGAAPGSWSQYAAQRIGGNGLLVAVDLQEVGVTFPNGIVRQCDAFTLDEAAVVEWTDGKAPPFDVVLSDMAPSTTGVGLADHVASVELCDHALGLAVRWLRPGGHFVCKVFQGEDEPALRKRIQAVFKKLKGVRPKGTRSHSREIFLVAQGRR